MCVCFVHYLLDFSNENIPVLYSENIIISAVSHNAVSFGLKGKDWSSAHSVLDTNSDGHTLWDVNH